MSQPPPEPPGPPAAAELTALLAAGDPPLDRCLALVAAHGRPGVGAERIVARLDELAGACRGDSPGTLCASLFGELGFHGDMDDYHDSRNSLLDQVLDRRRGMPITLAALAMEVGRRRGVPLVGIGMPGHFLLRAQNPTGPWFDAFDGGRVLDRDGCIALFRRVHGPGVGFEPAFLDPTPAAGIVVRVLNNLRLSAERSGDRAGLVRALELQAALPGAGVEERRRLAAAVAATGRFDLGAALYEELGREDPPNAEEHRRTATRLRASMN